MKFEEIKKMVELIDQSDLTEFCYETDEYKIKMKKEKEQVLTQAVHKEAAAATQLPVQSNEKEEKSIEETDDLQTINAPMVGTFYKAPSPESDAYVQVGDKVTSEKVVCILEAMKLFNEIQAEISGEIVEILVEDGQMVEYGQPLFKVK